MKYNQPFGISDPNAPYINGDPEIGREGSIPPAESIEYPQREIVNVIAYNGFTPDNADLTQLTRGIQRQNPNWVNIFGGTANALTCAPLPAPASLTDIIGMPIRGIAQFTNTGPVV